MKPTSERIARVREALERNMIQHHCVAFEIQQMIVGVQSE